MNDNILRETVRAILSEAIDDFGHDEFGHSRDGKPLAPSKPIDFEFPIWGSDDEEYTMKATYNPSTPFEMEVWHASGPDGMDVDVDELKARYDVDAAAWAWLEKLFD